MSGLSLDGSGISTVMPSTVNTYVPGLTAIQNLSITNRLGQANPSSGLTFRGSGLSTGITASEIILNLWYAAVVANGGTVSAARLAIINAFIAAEIAAGIWPLMDDYFPSWGENAPQALTSLKQRRLATVTAAPTFTADRGYVFNGTSNFINTGFVPSTHAVVMTGTNLRLAVYERTNVSANTTTAGVQSVSPVQLAIRARSGSGANTFVNVQINFTLGVADSRGYLAASRNGADDTTCFAYKNGAAQTLNITTPPYGTTLPTHALYIGARNNAGTADTFRACSVGFVAAGAQLSAAQEAAQYANVQAWATAIGANV